MECNDWIRKNEFQNMDHASDGKKKLSNCQDWKKEVIAEDTGRQVLSLLETGQFISSMNSLTEETIEDARRQAA